MSFIHDFKEAVKNTAYTLGTIFVIGAGAYFASEYKEARAKLNTSPKTSVEINLTQTEVQRFNSGLEKTLSPQNLQASTKQKSGKKLKQKPTPKISIHKPSNEDILARMLLGEARGKVTDYERLVIANVAENRANDKDREYGNNLRDVILKPKQFSCFNRNDPNYKVVKNPLKYAPKSFYKLHSIAEQALSTNEDYANGATHYYEKGLDKKGKAPKWARNMREVKFPQYFRHRFFK